MSGIEGIAAVAERIRDRANQLQSERAVLELVKAEQDQQQAILDEEGEVCGQVRRKYLTALRSRHGVELELWKMEEQKRECIEATEQLEQESKDILAYKEEIQENWERLVRDVIAPHTLHQEIYRHSFQASMDHVEKMDVKRNQQLSFLAMQIDAFRKERKRMESEKTHLQEEATQMEESKQKEDEEMAELATKSSEAAAEVSNLAPLL